MSPKSADFRLRGHRDAGAEAPTLRRSDKALDPPTLIAG